MLVREHDTPEQPLIQREYQKRWAYPARCKDARELAERMDGSLDATSRPGATTFTLVIPA